MTEATEKHVTTVVRIRSGIYRGRCSCHWMGPRRHWRISAADDTAAHLLEVSS